MKLFARHISLEDQEKALSTQDVRICVGTPNRLLKLCERGALNVERLRLCVLDLGRDAKDFNLFDTMVHEVRRDFWSLFHQFLAQRIKTAPDDRPAQLCLY